MKIKIGDKTKAVLLALLPLLEAELSPEAASVIKILAQGHVSHAQVLAALTALSAEPAA